MTDRRPTIAVEVADERAWLAWAAGVLDGEGCIYLAKPSVRVREWRVQVYVVNTDRRMLDRMKQLFGGGVIGPIRKTPPRKPIWRWIVEREKATSCLRRTRPWLVIKGDQADTALAADLARQADATELLEEARKQLRHSKEHPGDASRSVRG